MTKQVIAGMAVLLALVGTAAAQYSGWQYTGTLLILTTPEGEIALEFDQPMAWSDALTSQFYLDGKEGKVASGAASGNMVKLKLASTESAKAITYLVDRKWDIKNLLYGENGIAAFTFCDVPILTDKLSP